MSIPAAKTFRGQFKKMFRGGTHLEAIPESIPGDALAMVGEPTSRTMFNQTVLEHFRNPHNVGEAGNASAAVEVENPVCGDVLRLSVRMEAGRVAEARFKTQGCVAAIAASSVLTDLLLGKSSAEFRAITPQQISEKLGTLPPATFHAAQLCVDALGALASKLV